MTKFTEKRERMLLDPEANPQDRAEALACMRADRLVKHESLVASLVQHPAGYLRAEALMTLLQWNRPEWVPLAIERAAEDAEAAARGILARELGYAGRNYPQYREEILRRLASLVEDDPDEFVASTAYTSLRFLVHEKARHPGVPKLDFDRRTDVDWSLVERYRGRQAGRK